MIEVTQTLLHDKEKGVVGNCLQAAFASLLELPIDDVPHFVAMEDCWGAIQEWFRERYNAFYLVVEADQQGLDWYLWHAGHYIVTGTSPRGLQHAVIGEKGEIVFDPHPSRAGLTDIKRYGFIVPLDPKILSPKD